MFPEMTVEKRDGASHGLPAPTNHVENREQIEDMLTMVEAAKQVDEFPAEILNKYLPFGDTLDAAEYDEIMSEFGFSNWAEVVDFVRDDDPIELAVRVAKWVHANGFGDNGKTFIDKRLSVWNRFVDFAEPIMQEGFDEKYWWWNKLKTLRPIELLQSWIGFFCPALLVYMHPGHPTYPAGHSCIFAAIYEFAKREWPELTEDAIRFIAVVCYVAAMGRGGAGVHFPEDNTAGFLIAAKHAAR